MSGATCWPRCPLIISIIQEGVIGGSVYSGPAIPWFTSTTGTHIHWGDGWLEGSRLCRYLRWPLDTLMASFIAICRIWKDTTWELGLFNGHRWLLSVSPRLCPQFAYIQHVKYFDLFEILLPLPRNVFLPPVLWLLPTLIGSEHYETFIIYLVDDMWMKRSMWR